MPDINVKHVVSSSSEDRNYEAANLVKSDGYKKWKIAKAGEKSASVTLQFEKASKIHQIDIGNESSAFVEVLVGKSDMEDQDFQVLLVASSFMNPLESRGGQNGCRVRIFSADNLSKTCRDQKWDRVKLVCTQPFNKSVQYGLSFVRFHSPPEPGEKTEPKPQVKLGAFAVKADSDEDNISAGSLFAQSKEKKEPVPLTGAAAVRAASKLAQVSATNSTSSREPAHSKTCNRKASAEVEGKASEKPPAVHLKRQSTETPPAVHLKRQSTSVTSVSSTSSTASPLKRSKTEPPKPSKEKEFSKMMKKVVFVISGFQNPFRSKLRDMALEMGASYKPDWGSNCTHLICAFDNTPKYKQVSGKGRIVKKDWVLESYKQKRLLSWRKYRLGRAKSPAQSSEESSDEEHTPAITKKSPSKQTTESSLVKKVEGVEAAASTSKHVMDYDDSTDEMDTDDEIARIQGDSSRNTGEKGTASSHLHDIYNKSTDEEMDSDRELVNTPLSSIDALQDLPDLFMHKSFFFYGHFAADDMKLLKRYVIAYDGEVVDYMSDKVCYVVTDSVWDKHFDDALQDNPGLFFVHSDWLHCCHDNQKLVPHQKFAVSPKC